MFHNNYYEERRKMRKRNYTMLLRFAKTKCTRPARKHEKQICPVRGAAETFSGAQGKRKLRPLMFPKLVFEVRRVGSNIDQTLKTTNARGLPDVPQLRKALEENDPSRS